MAGEPPTKYERISTCEWLCERPPRDTEDYTCECARKHGACSDDSCLNRALQIECTSSCRAGKFCQNRRMGRRQGADIECRPAGRKGHGLFLRSGSLKPGDFIAEYVGEVYNLLEFDRRREEYKAAGGRHLYFMNLDADHIVDATRKGSLTRFINHSCDPVMELQKWTVNGVTRLGFYASTNISAGDELVFDYQYQRIDEDSHPCYCGSDNCRGELGAKREPGQAEPAARRSLSATERAMKQIYRAIDNLRGEDGGLTEVAAADLIKLMMNTKQSEYRRAILDFLMGSSSSAAKTNFLRLRGLQFLRVFLDDFAQSGDGELLKLVLKVLSVLPVATQNVVKQASILPVLQRLCSFGDADVADSARRLTEQWIELEEVMVIEMRADAADPIEEKIPRKYLAFYRESTLRRIEQETSARLAFTKDNSHVEYKFLKISGTQKAVDCAQEEVVKILQTAEADVRAQAEREAERKRIKEEERERSLRRSSMGSNDSDAFSTRGGSSRDTTPRRQLPVNGYRRDLNESNYAPSRGPSWAAGPAPPAAPEVVLPPGWERAWEPSACGGRGAYYYWDNNNPGGETCWSPPPTKSPPTESKVAALMSKPDRLSISAANPDALKTVALSVQATSATSRVAAKSEAHTKKVKMEIAECVRDTLKRYRKKDCKIGYISSDKDFKHLCRKLSHLIMKKETGTEVDDAMRHKIKNFVKGYMKKIGVSGYRRAVSSP